MDEKFLNDTAWAGAANTAKIINSKVTVIRSSNLAETEPLERFMWLAPISIQKQILSSFRAIHPVMPVNSEKLKCS